MSQMSLSGATEKLSTWKPQRIPDEFERKALRELCIQAVFWKWANKRCPTDLNEINAFVRAKIREKRKLGEWPFPDYRGKRTIDRRVNEAACPSFSEDGVAKIVAVTAGIYQPNPKLFEGFS